MPSPAPSTGGTTPHSHSEPSSGNIPILGDRSPTASGRKSSVAPRMMNAPTMNCIGEVNSRGTPAEVFPVAETYPRLLEYLALPDAEIGRHAQSSQFKHQLGMAMKEIESNRASMRDKANTREDYSRLQRENAQIKEYLDSTHSPRNPAISSPSTVSHNITSRPASEQRGKAWDSLALDMF